MQMHNPYNHYTYFNEKKNEKWKHIIEISVNFFFFALDFFRFWIKMLKVY